MSPFDIRQDAQEATRLHEILTPLEGMPPTLYMEPESRAEAGPGGVFRLPPRGRLETDTYFNAFYLNFWQAHVRLTRIGVLCRASGVVALRLMGHRADGGSRVMADWMDAGDGDDHVHWVWLDPSETGPEATVRLSLSLATAEGADIHELSYVTERVAEVAPRLVVGICTRDREAHLEATLAVLAELAETSPVLQRVVVVNHGRPLQRSGLRQLVQQPLFRMVHQINLGGSGGFARAMLEAQEGELAPSHVLLMDDDIRLDARMIPRALAFAGLAGEVAVGGQAIELEQPTRLQESRGNLGRNWTPVMEGAGVDLTEPAARALWSRATVADYNGWWFCLMPMSAVRRCGLPMPCFIRGDDIEYGLRLRAAGVPLVPLPGVAVWHASVRYKFAGVVSYYDLRNMLITASAHPEHGDLPETLYMLGYVLHHMLVHRYRSAAACLMALRDFLDGPDVALAADAARRHRALVRAVEGIPPPARCAAVAEGMERLVPFNMKAPYPRVWQVVLLVLKVLLQPLQRGVRLLQIGPPDPIAVRGRPYLLALDPAGRSCLVMRPQRGRFLLYLLQLLWLGARYAIWRGAARRRWRRAIPRLQSRDRWLREFAARPI